MDSDRTIKNKNPRETANTISVLFWWWTIGLFKKGYNKVLGIEDLYEPLSADKSNVLGDRLEAKWKAAVINAQNSNHKQPSLLKTIFITFLPEYLILGCLHFFTEIIIRFGTPLLLGALLLYFKPKPTTTYDMALLYAGGISLAIILNALAANNANYRAYHIGGKIRVAVCSVVYRKALRLSKTALGETASGKVVNLVANDVNRFDLVSILIHYMWSAPLSALLVAYLLYYQAGVAGLVGMAPVFIIVPIQAYAGKLTSKIRLRTAIKTDERVRLMNEIISGVTVIKMYAWEKPFCMLVGLARRSELKEVGKSGRIRGIHMTFNLFTTRIALYCTLLAMLMSGESLTAEKVFVFSSYFNIMAFTMTGMFIRGIAEISECLVAVRRLQNFLLYEEFKIGNVIQDTPRSSIENNRDNTKRVSKDKEESSKKEEETWAVKLDHVTARWDLNSTENTLEDVSIDVEKGKLYIVIGLVGTGKSSLLSVVLGELNLIQGSVRVKGGISYASQEPWVFGATVKQNILFGLDYDKTRYQNVVKVCALQTDFKQFPQGDQTIVGERGSSLSGGQKARINLARSVYRQADIYLLDDPLSAVDAHVGKHLFEECIQKYLKRKTRILATHQLQYIKDADSIIVLDQGKIQQFGNYRELLQAHPEYEQVISNEDNAKNLPGDKAVKKAAAVSRKMSRISTRSRKSDSSGGETDDEEEENGPDNLAGFIEGTSRGAVKGNITLKYFKAGSGIFVILILVFLFLLTQFVVSLNDFFIPKLLVAEESRSYYQNNRKTGSNEQSVRANHSSRILKEEDILPRDHYVYIYSGIVASIFIIAILRSFTFYSICIKSSQRLHDLAFGALIHANLNFFDLNPSGRILNRFSKDMSAIDEWLPKTMLDATQNILCMIGALIVACTVNPIFCVPILILGIIFYMIRRVYLKTSKNIKRLEGMTRAPVFTHLNTTLDGISTIRACEAERILKYEFDMYQDIHTASWYMFLSSMIAFGFTLDLFCFLFTSMVTFSFLLVNDGFTGGQVGLAITQVMALTGMVQFGMRQAAEVANQMTSVERVLEYAQIEPEKNFQSPAPRSKKKNSLYTGSGLVELPECWPTEGSVEFKNVYLRYSEDDPPVLRGLSMSIQSGEKIGIVGRTGAGKSTLIAALFRLAKIDGVIEIDGIDTGKIALEDLRQHISIIPQDPLLFSGTLRRNLDPFQEYSDEILWQALEKVELKDAVKATGDGLDHRVLDKGSNYSVGQRQLICLARTIIKNNRILVLDEATANVDPQTDTLIQNTIRNQFSDCTVLTIAHRLNTIMDSDKVLVMDQGKIEEYDHPHILLNNEKGHFTSLTKETGPAMYQQLREAARRSFGSKPPNAKRKSL